MEHIIFVNQGGIGKDIMATVPIRNLKKKFPDKKIVTVSGHPWVFQFNPNVELSFQLGNTPNFYEIYKDSMWVRTEPYYHSDYISKTKHLTRCWCEQIDVDFDNSKPDLFLSPREKEAGLNYVRSKNAPILLIQFQGGAAPQRDKDNNLLPPIKMFVRDVPLQIIKNVSVALENRYKTIIIGLPSQNSWTGVESLTGKHPRELLSVILHANKLLLIDSFIQHAAAALNRQAVVCWGATSPDILGYNTHINLRRKSCDTPECHRPNSYLNDIDYQGKPWTCPTESCTFHSEESILNALDGQSLKGIMDEGER